jgi:TonB family protein
MRKWQSRRTLLIALITSLLLHALFVIFTFVAPYMMDTHKPEIIEVSYEEPPQPVDMTQLPEDKLLKQVVEQDEKPINDEKPKDPKFLSAHDQTIKKQTVAPKVGEFRNRKEQQNFDGTGGKPQLKLQDLKPDLDISKLIEKKHREEMEIEKTLDENALKVANEKAADKKPEPAPAEKPGTAGAESSQSTDYLKDVDKGAETLLSTREFVYYTFYARIRRQLSQYWGGKVREKLAKIVKEGRSIASSEDKVTKLLITLDRGGHLTKVQVVGDSGVRDLDDAAIEAFKEAAPFPNPPAGIVEQDGTIKIRWDFILEA